MQSKNSSHFTTLNEVLEEAASCLKTSKEGLIVRACSFDITDMDQQTVYAKLAVVSKEIGKPIQLLVRSLPKGSNTHLKTLSAVAESIEDTTELYEAFVNVGFFPYGSCFSMTEINDYTVVYIHSLK